MKYNFTTLLLLIVISLSGQKQKVWIDADTGNEMDDVWAIVRLLWAKDKVDVMGLSSAHFNNADLIAFDKWNQYDTKDIRPILLSQELNEKILKEMNLSHIPHPIGADKQMGRAWGQTDPRPSDATTELLKVITSLKENEKLDILQIGAATNIASLIALHPEVKSKIRLFSMGLNYDLKTKAWNKNEFNIRCDLNATDFLFNQEGLDWTIITVQTCLPYKFNREETYAKLDEKYAGERLMKQRWMEGNPESKDRILWDLALVQAYLRPELATVISVKTPPENHQHKVKIYSKINLSGFYEDFWNAVKINKNLK
jgi:purine nucleosidase